MAYQPQPLGQQTMANSGSVVIASNQSAIPISGTVTVDTSLLATAAKQDTGNTSLAGILTGVQLLDDAFIDNPTQDVIAAGLSAWSTGANAFESQGVETIGSAAVGKPHLFAGLDNAATKLVQVPTVESDNATAFNKGMEVLPAISKSAGAATTAGRATALQVHAITGGVLSDQTSWGGTAVDAAAALADNMTNTPVVPKVAAYMVGLDAAGGSNADRATLATLFDLDTGAGIQSVLGLNLRTGASGGSVEAGTATTPLAVYKTYSPTNITTLTTTVVKSGAGVLHTVTINTPAATGVITIYNNTAGSGTKIGTITQPATLLSSGPVTLTFDVAFSTGLTIVTATAAQDITVSWL